MSLFRMTTDEHSRDEELTRSTVAGGRKASLSPLDSSVTGNPEI